MAKKPEETKSGHKPLAQGAGGAQASKHISRISDHKKMVNPKSHAAKCHHE